MPRKSRTATPTCINHPGKRMVLADKTNNTNAFHIIGVATLEENTYVGQPLANAVDLFVCQICGYCEIYLTDREFSLLSED